MSRKVGHVGHLTTVIKTVIAVLDLTTANSSLLERLWRSIPTHVPKGPFDGRVGVSLLMLIKRIKFVFKRLLQVQLLLFRGHGEGF